MAIEAAKAKHKRLQIFQNWEAPQIKNSKGVIVASAIDFNSSIADKLAVNRSVSSYSDGQQVLKNEHKV